MEIKELLKEARTIWGDEKLTPEQIFVRLGVTVGDMARWIRNTKKDKANHTDEEMKKEMGNAIFSLIRWCDDMGYDLEECIKLAKEAQEKFAKSGNR